MLRLARNFTAICAAIAILLSTVVARPPATFAESAGPRIIETTATSLVFDWTCLNQLSTRLRWMGVSLTA